MKKKAVCVKDVKYDIGTKIFTIGYRYGETTKKCPYCDSEGNIKINKTTFPCPASCNSGYVTAFMPGQWCVITKNKAITNIEIACDKSTNSVDNMNSIVYWTNNEAGTMQDQVFLTLKEAQQECHRLNKLRNCDE